MRHNVHEQMCFEYPSESTVAIQQIRDQISRPEIEIYSGEIPVFTGNFSGIAYANIIVLENVRIHGGYKIACVAKIQNVGFPAGLFLIVVGNTLRHIIHKMQADLGMDDRQDCKFANAKVVHGAG